MPSVILLDVAGVIVGTLAGCAMKKHISGSLNESINLALAVISAAVGVGLLGKAVHMSAAVLFRFHRLPEEASRYSQAVCQFQ